MFRRLVVYAADRRLAGLSRFVLQRLGVTRRYEVEWIIASTPSPSPPALTEVAAVLTFGGYAEALTTAEWTDAGERVPWAGFMTLPAFMVPTEELEVLQSADWLGSPWRYGRRLLRDLALGLQPRVLPVAFPGSRFRPLARRKALRAQQGLRNGFVVGVMARNEGHTRLPAVLKAAARAAETVPELVVEFLTDTTTYWPKESVPQRTGWDLAELANRYGIADRVFVARGSPWFNGADAGVNAFCNLLDLLVLGGVGDGSGLEAVQAMACGVPVVGPDYGVPGEIVAGRGLPVQVAARWLSAPDSEEWILPDVDDLAARLCELQRDGRLRARCVRAGRRFARRFEWEQVRGRWEKVVLPWLAGLPERQRRKLLWEAHRPRRILVRRERGIGDVLFALSVAAQLVRDDPRARVEFVTTKDHAPWVDWFDFVKNVHVEPPDDSFDRVLDFERELEYNYSGDRTEWMARRAGIEPPPFPAPPKIPAAIRNKARRRLAKAHGNLVVIAPYASRATPVRSLTREQIQAVVDAVQPEDTAVLLCHQRIPGVTAPNLLNLAGRLPVEEAIAVVSRCDGFIGVDSGFVHWAGVFRKPVVALFTHIGALQRMGPHENFVAIQPSLPCAPCGDVWPLGPHGHQPPCRPTYRWTRDEPRLRCLQVHDGRLAVTKLYELMAGRPRRTVVNVDTEKRTTEWALPLLAETTAPATTLEDLTAVVILNHGTWRRCTERCVEQALRNTTPPCQVVVLDNGSSAQEAALVEAGGQALQRRYPKQRLRLVRAPHNLGFPAGVNRALKEVSDSARYVCLLNSDCYLNEPGWNARAALLFGRDWRLAALSLTQGEHRYFLDGRTGKDYFFPELDAELGPCEVINGACFLVDRKKTGPFQLDERFSPASREDDDLSFWIRAQGWSVAQAPDFDVVHEHNTTLRRKGYTLHWQGVEWDYFELQQRNRRLLLEKWAPMLHPRRGAAGSLKAIARFYRPRVTVILPTYRRLHVNGPAIDSVRRQTLTDLELLLVTRSKAEQRELAERYAGDKRVRVLLQTRPGIANARNTGLAAARGVYVAHMDDDEYWRRDHLERMVDFLDRHENVMLAYADVHRVRGRFTEGRFIREKDEGYPWCREFDLGAFLQANCIPASAAVMRREVVDSVGYFDERFRYADDWEYWLRIAVNHRVAHNCTLTQEGLATVEYRSHGEDQATRRDPQVWDAEFARIRKLYAKRNREG